MYGLSSEALSRVYVRGSLRNKDDGFTFELKNNIESGSISKISGLIVDGSERSLEGVTFQNGSQFRQATEISYASPSYVRYGATSIVHVPGALEPGEHTIVLKVRVSEAGELSLPLTDTVP